MGVRGLTSYINSIGGLWTQIELQNTRLVIDGPSLYSVLYTDNGLDQRCGGQYEEFYNIVLSFFDALHSRGVEAFVILDGAHDSSDKKLDTFKQRSVERIQTADSLARNNRPANEAVFLLPLLTNLVFVQALKDRGVKFAVADNEADTEIASLANTWNCPVLSNDSDFFIFDIKGGYIPLPSFDWKSSHLRAKIFHRRKLASHLGIREELLPLFASLVGNDYVSWDALDPFTRALIRDQTSLRHLSRKEAKFASIARLLSTVPHGSVLQMVSCYGGDQLRKAVEHSLQEYAIRESNLLRYFQGGVVCSSLRTKNNRQVVEWVLRKFRDGQFSVNCISGLTAGKVLLRFQVENSREISANRCSQHLRRLVYGILDDATAQNGRGNIPKVQEWDREGLTIVQTSVTPYQEGVVPSVSLVPHLDDEVRQEVLLVALDSNTAYIRYLPEKFKLIVASLRFLAKKAQPSLEMNHLAALLCSCVKLEDGSWIQYMENVKRNWRISLSQPFDLRAAHSFAQWQCVLRDAIHLNFVLLEPVESPCVHKTFNGHLVQYLLNELDHGRRPEELLPSSSNRFLYKELYSAVTNEKGERIGVDTSRTQNVYQTRDVSRSSIQSYNSVGNRAANASQKVKRREEIGQPRQPHQQFMTQREKEVPTPRHTFRQHSGPSTAGKPLFPQDGAPRKSIPASSSQRYREFTWGEYYASALLPLSTKQHHSVRTESQHAGNSQPVAFRSNRVVPEGACTQNTKEDEIASMIQNLNLGASPYHPSGNFVTGESRYSRSTQPPRVVSPQGEVTRSVYYSPSHPSHSRSVSAASYNSLGYRKEISQKPPNVTSSRPMSATVRSPPSKHNDYPFSSRPGDESKARSVDDQPCRYHQPWRSYNPLAPSSDTLSWSSEKSWQDDDSIASDEESWSDDYTYITSKDFEDEYSGDFY